MSKKSLGQHFLINQGVHRKIAETAEIKAGDTVVEVGPGHGELTDHLLATGAKVIAIEKDSELAVFLREKYRNNKNIEIVEDDILKFDPSFVIRHSSFVIVGNIPYYLTSHLLRVVLQDWPPPDLIVFIIQKEVAQRIVAKPPKMNMIALLVQCYGIPKIIMTVKKGSFNPPPKVDSAIIKLKIKSQKSKMGKGFLNLVAKGFKHPRKMLGYSLPKDKLLMAGIDPKRRPSTLSLDEWKTLWEIMV